MRSVPPFWHGHWVTEVHLAPGLHVTGPSLRTVGRKPTQTEACCMPAAGPRSTWQSLQWGIGCNRPVSRCCRCLFQVKKRRHREADTPARGMRAHGQGLGRYLHPGSRAPQSVLGPSQGLPHLSLAAWSLQGTFLMVAL